MCWAALLVGFLLGALVAISVIGVVIERDKARRERSTWH